MKIKEQTRKLAAGCSKHCFEVVDRTDEVSSKHSFEVVDRTDEVSSKHSFEVVDRTDEVSNHTYGKETLTWFAEIFEEYKRKKLAKETGMEQTFFIIKPDGVKRGLVGEVLKRIEQRGFTIEKLELCSKVSEELIDQHYQDLVGQSFYPPIREFMTSGPVLVGVISGPKVIETWRTMMGATRPEEALPGTIRGDFAKSAGENEAIQNVVHGSDSEESAKREIALWFEEK